MPEDVRFALDASQVQAIRASADAAAKLQQALERSDSEASARESRAPSAEDLRTTVDVLTKAVTAAERALRFGERVAERLSKIGLVEAGQAAQLGEAATVLGGAARGGATGFALGLAFGPGGAAIGGAAGLAGGTFLGGSITQERRDAAEIVQRERNRAFREEQAAQARLQGRLR